MTTSLKVAEYFGKQHKDVLRRIQTLDCSPEFTERNFTLSEYVDPTGRRLPHYELTRDAFMFTVMGFTGHRAARVKEAYIEAFNMMEDRLRNPMMMLPDSEKIELLVLGIEMEREKNAELTEQVAEMAPKAEVHDRSMDLGDSMTMRNAAKVLGIKQ